MRPYNYGEHNSGSVITGSSNVSEQGLGTNDMFNYEFNVLLSRFDDVDFALNEFNKLWNEAVDILPEEIKKIQKTSHLREDITPYELYLKLLIEYFGKSIDRDPIFTDDLPEKYTPLQYQADAVNQGFQMLKDHNGLILADVVGLGKTIIAAQIIRKYIRFNGFNTKILVVYPPALESNWKATLKDFKIQHYVHFVTNGSLHKLIEAHNYDYYSPEDYDFVIVDESHGFRSAESERYALLQLICKTPRVHAGNDKDTRKKVMLLSATPLNNRPEDIANQLYLFQDMRASTLEGVPNLQKFFASKIKEYKKIHKIKDHNQLIKKVKEIYEPIRDKIMSQLVIRRTRADIENIPEYMEDMNTQGICFPKTKGPYIVRYTFDEVLTKLFYKTVYYLTEENTLGYYRYRAIEFLRNEEHKNLYDNAELISRQLARIMQTQLTKRLESSFSAFKKSLKRLQERNRRMIQMIDQDKIYIAPDMDVNKLYEEGREDELDKEIEKLQDQGKENNRIFGADDFDVELKYGLKHDQKIIDELVEEWDKIDYDPKFERFLETLHEKLQDSENVENKLVIFTESSDTVYYLRDKLTENDVTDILAIDSNNQKERFNTIRKNFDANIDENEKENRYNIMITTEVLAEGINLHRSNFVLNYDIPWNATRLMQRIGRLNRLGAKADYIFVFNYYPTSVTNELIKLNETALKKLQGFHSAFSEDSKIYSELEELQKNILGDHRGQAEEQDKMLKKLTFIRQIKDKQPQLFEQAKSIPLKARLARFAKNVNLENTNLEGNIEGYTLSYIRNDYQDGFFLSNGTDMFELTFYQAIQLFESQQNEKSTTLPHDHFKHVQNSINNFKDNVIQVENDYAGDEENLSGKEKQAIKFLSSLQKQRANKPELYNDEFDGLIDTALMLIYFGTFRKLRNEIAQLASDFKKKNMQSYDGVKQLSKIFAEYPLATIQRLEKLRKEQREEKAQKMRVSKVNVVLSESFV